VKVAFFDGSTLVIPSRRHYDPAVAVTEIVSSGTGNGDLRPTALVPGG